VRSFAVFLGALVVDDFAGPEDVLATVDFAAALDVPDVLGAFFFVDFLAVFFLADLVTALFAEEVAVVELAAFIATAIVEMPAKMSAAVAAVTSSTATLFFTVRPSRVGFGRFLEWRPISGSPRLAQARRCGALSGDDASAASDARASSCG
jgi:hypothetical protein